MKKTILLLGLVAAIALSGCTQPAAEPTYKYVCSDGSMVNSPALCQTVECIDCDQYCEDYCAGIQDTDELTVESVKDEMEEANYCETKDDCVETNTKCPIGCYNMVNTAELDRINELVRQFKQTCFQSCTDLDEHECVEGKCEPTLPGTS